MSYNMSKNDATKIVIFLKSNKLFLFFLQTAQALLAFNAVNSNSPYCIFQQYGEFMLDLSVSHGLASLMLEVCFLHHLLFEFESGGVVLTHLHVEDGVGLVIIGSSGLSAVLPSCPFPVVAGQLEVGDCCW